MAQFNGDIKTLFGMYKVVILGYLYFNAKNKQCVADVPVFIKIEYLILNFFLK